MQLLVIISDKNKLLLLVDKVIKNVKMIKRTIPFASLKAVFFAIGLSGIIFVFINMIFQLLNSYSKYFLQR